MTVPLPPATDGFLAELGTDDSTALLARVGRRRFPSGTTLMYEGQAGTEVMVIVSGRVKISYLTAEGQEVVLDFRGPGEMLGELAVIDGKPRSSSVVAIEPVETLAIAAASFLSLVSERTGIATALLHDIVRRFRDSDRKRIEFGTAPAIGRVAARLVELVERYGTPTSTGHIIDLPIRQEELAGWTGSSREAVARALRSLRELGLITTERRRITVLDLAELKQHCR